MKKIFSRVKSWPSLRFLSATNANQRQVRTILPLQTRWARDRAGRTSDPAERVAARFFAVPGRGAVESGLAQIVVPDGSATKMILGRPGIARALSARQGLALLLCAWMQPGGSAAERGADKSDLEERAWSNWLEPSSPFFSSVLDARNAGPASPAENLTPRGLVLDLGDNQWVCFDVDLLRVSAAWTGKAVTEDSMAAISYRRPTAEAPPGQTRLSRPAGDVWLGNGIYPGWQVGLTPALVDPRPPAPTPSR